jgi:holin-like protein
MHGLSGFALLLLYQLFGEVLVRIAGLPFPGPVLGMLLLLVMLAWRGASDTLAASAETLLSHLSLLFVPAGVGVMVNFGRLEGEWLPIVAALLFSTFATFAATALAMQWLSRRLLRAGDDHGR